MLHVSEMYIAKLTHENCVRELLSSVLSWEIKMVYLICVCVYSHISHYNELLNNFYLNCNNQIVQSFDLVFMSFNPDQENIFIWVEIYYAVLSLRILFYSDSWRVKSTVVAFTPHLIDKQSHLRLIQLDLSTLHQNNSKRTILLLDM